MQRLQYRQEQGFSIAEVMVVLCIVAMMLPILILEYEKGHAMRMARQAAEHLAKVNKAASEYVQAHHERLSTEASASSGPEITVAVLLHEHLLPTGFSPKNLWGQEYRIYMRKPRSNELHAIVLTTGGYRTDEPAFINTLVPTAATMLHGGGFIPSGLVPGQSSGTLQGAFGGWKLEL
ncbi:MAG: shufflon system plasmid conjugative transfer pilus tip adhesin PilV, partial [Bilophila sp.]